MDRASEDRRTVLILAFSCLILYFNSLWNNFIFDDLHSIIDNLYIRGIRYIPLLFKGYYTSVLDIPKGMLRPFLMLSFGFNYYVSGIQPLGYHIVNIVIHFLNGILLYSLLRFFKKDIAFGLVLFLSILFICHPINSETVTYISCRSDLLVTFLIISAFFVYLKGRFFFSLFLFILALLTKENALVLVPLVFAYDFLYTSNPDNIAVKKSNRQRYVFYLALICLAISYWVYRSIVFNLGSKEILLASFNSPLRSFWSNTFIQSVVAIFYLRLFVWPHPLNLVHVFTGLDSVLELRVFFSIFIVMAMIVLIFVLRKKRPLISFGLAWYLICLLPKFYAVLHFPATEHHFYLPSIGIYLVLAEILRTVYQKFRRNFIYIACGILSIFTVLVWIRNCEWKNSLTFYSAAVRRDPNSAVLHNNLAIEYSRMGLAEIAEKEFKKAMSLSNTTDVQVNCRINLAKIYSNQQKFKEATGLLNEALSIKPDYATIYQVSGFIYTQMNQRDKAEETWKQGLKYNPKAAGIMDNLGFFYLDNKQLKEAKEYFQSAIKYKPDDSVAFFGLGQVLEQENNLEAAISAYTKSYKFDPVYVPTNYALGTIYAKRLDRRALWHLKEAVRLKFDFAEAHNNLAVLYASIEPPQIDLARQHAQKALNLGYPVEKKVLENIGLSGVKKEN